MKFKDLHTFISDTSKGLNSYNLETLAYTVAKEYETTKKQILLVLPSLYDTQNLQEFLIDYLDSENIYLYLFDEVIRVNALGTSKEMMYERLRTLFALYNGQPGVFIFNTAALLRPTLSKKQFLGLSKTYRINDRFNRSDFLSLVMAAGYIRKSRVEHPGEFAIKGMIIDFFSPALYQPTRIELDGNEIVDIRSFDPSTEVSNQTLESAILSPANDLLYLKEDKEEIIKKLRREKTPATDLKIESLVAKLDSENDGLLVPYMHFRYYGEYETILMQGLKFEAYHSQDIINRSNKYIENDRLYFSEQYNAGQSLLLDSLYLKEALGYLGSSLNEIKETEDDILTSLPYNFESLVTFSQRAREIIEDGYSIVAFLPKERRANLYQRLIDDKLPFVMYPESGDLVLVDGSLSTGLLDKKRKIAYLGTKEIFGLKNRSASFLTRYKEAKIIRRFDDLSVGDYVIHEMHGIGRYEGVVKYNGLDYLKVIYKDNDELLIPLVQFKLIRKYSGREGYTPSLDKMGGSTWSRRKAKIRGKLVFLADQLLEVTSKRMMEKGFAFPTVNELEREFSDSFAYELTPSQVKAYDAIRKGMESEQPMDHLLAGDVGFGKTELAFRAAFKAILADKQVAILCPTTVLCRQHYEVAVHRFRGFGVKIACFSRFVPLSEQEENIRRLKEGKINLVIGTHRILSDDIVFKDLGLLVVDEEQRFGVAQKEKIKKLGGNIDVLTLTATPIPRTLQMSLLGLRELSNLEAPPLNRLPIKTYVTYADDGLIKEAMELELGRGGQVYYLHNRVKTIYSKAAKLKKLFPYASIAVAHGQMTSTAMADVMNAFYDGHVDILVCTTIIETGLDIQNVNTIIVEDADYFGLAQLYQIKGRVGRSDKLAYAYLLYDKNKELGEDSKKRLKALKDFTELGSGYNIAKQDLNLRGAGNILGAEQAGFMDTLGFENYQALLDEVIKQKKYLEGIKVEMPQKHSYTLSFSLDSVIPDDYVDETARVTIYRELASIEEDEDLEKFAKKIRDVYGPYPLEVYNLFVKKRIEIMLSAYYISEYIEGLDHYEIGLTREATVKRINASDLESALDSVKEIVRIFFKGGCLHFRIKKTNEYLEELLFIMTYLNSKCNEGILDKTT